MVRETAFDGCFVLTWRVSCLYGSAKMLTPPSDGVLLADAVEIHGVYPGPASHEVGSAPFYMGSYSLDAPRLVVGSQAQQSNNSDKGFVQRADRFRHLCTGLCQSA